MKLIDTHAHILKSSFKEGLETVIKDLNTREMKSINVAFDIDSSVEALNIFKTNKNIFPTVGIHPSDTKKYNLKQLKRIESLITSDIVAIGEIGLDYHYDGYDKETQKKAFIDQIELAKKYSLPIIIHTRDSLDDCYEIIKNYPNQKFLLHSWSGDIKMTKNFLKISNNIYFSYNGIITFKNALIQNETIGSIPIERIMFETDCPYLSPVPHRGKTNYPWRVEEVIKYCAKKLNIEFNKLNDINIKNAYDFFEIDGKEN